MQVIPGKVTRVPQSTCPTRTKHAFEIHINIPMAILRLTSGTAVFRLWTSPAAGERPSRAVSSPGHASASTAAAGATEPLARCRTRSREASTSETTTGISAIYWPLRPAQRFDATPRHRNDILSCFFRERALRPPAPRERRPACRRRGREDLCGRP